MMLNPKFSASKKKQGSPRSPLKLKDLNISSSSSSSCSSSFSSSTTATSISSEGPRGCLRFFLPHHSSTLSKNGNNSKFKCSSVGSSSSNKTPKSAPNVRSNLRGKVVKKRSNLPNPDNFTARKVKRNPPVPSSSRYDLSHGVNKFTSGFQLKLSDDSKSVGKSRKLSSRYDLSDEIGKNSDNAVNGRKFSSRYDFSGVMNKLSTGVEGNLRDSSEDFTPVNKLGCGFGAGSFSRSGKAVKLVENAVNCADGSRSPTPPPVQASVSPEIQTGLTSVVAATPTTCYAAGHVLSGVTDRRKCRPKGILTIGNNDLFGSGKTKSFRSEGESVVREVSNRRDSIVPSPTEASVCWLSSPSDAKKSKGCGEECDGSIDELRLNQCGKLVPFKLVGCSSSPSSSLGFSSELFNKSNCTISTSEASTCTPNSRRSKSSVLHSDLSSEFRGVLGPSLDHLVRSQSPPSPIATPPSKIDFSPEQGKFRHDYERQASPDLEDSLGSGNVMQTPESNSRSNFRLSHQSPEANSRSPKFGLSELSRDQISRLWFESELDSVAEVLRRVSVSPDCQMTELDSPRPSFEFNPLIKLDSSIDFAFFRKVMDTETPDISEALMQSLPEDPEVRISWREGLASRMFEMDELDCCRYLSDEEEDNANESKDASESCPCPEVDATVSDKIAEDPHNATCPVQLEGSNNRKREENPPLEGRESCLDSLQDDGRHTPVPEDSSWTACYKNNLFQV